MVERATFMRYRIQCSGARLSKHTRRGAMDLGLSEEQTMLREFARDFLEKECPESLVRDMETDEHGYSPDLWRKMAEQGWTGLVVPDSYGGVGMTYLDLVILAEELGRALVPGP